MKKQKNFLIIILMLTALLVISGCSIIKKNNANTPVNYTTYHDVPDITDDEIAAIKVLQTQRGQFVYGVPVSTEAFFDNNGEIRGFARLYCDWLTQLFGIKFVPANYEFVDLIPALESGKVDFAGGLAPTELRQKQYYMTSAIIERNLVIYRVEGSTPLSEIRDLRKLKYVFLRNSVTTDLAISLLDKNTYEPIFVDRNTEALELLRSGAADGYVHQNTTDVVFKDMNIVSEDFVPPAFIPVCLTAGNEKLQPIISVVQKALEHGQLKHIAEMYKQGEQEYKAYKLSSALTADETLYIKEHPLVHVVANYGDYPVSFFNKHENEWQGISIDILNRISEMTGMSFSIINGTDTNQAVLLQMLKGGQAAMISGIVHPVDKELNVIRTDETILLDRPALISSTDYDHIDLNGLLDLKTGTVSNSVYSEIYKRFFPHLNNIAEYKDTDSAFNALTSGNVDMVFLGESSLLNLANYRETAGYKVNMTFNYPVESTFGFNENEKTLCSIINKAMKIIDKDEIASQWMNRTYDYRTALVEAKLPWIIAAAILLVCASGLALILIIKKSHEEKKEVSRKMIKEISEANERTQILLDAMPVSCHLWNRNLEIYDCNEESIRLFNLKNKKEFTDNFLKFAPEIQPDGQPSREKARMWLQKAFIEGRAVLEFMHKTSDGILIPSEITLVRVTLKGEYAVAAYVRDLREQKKNMYEIEHRDKLLSTSNNIASILLQSEFDRFEENLQNSMRIIAGAVGIDSVYIWKNHCVDGRLHCSNIHTWPNERKLSSGIDYETTLPGWEEALLANECINRVVRELSSSEQTLLKSAGILTLLVVPVFVKDDFWGYVGYGNCHSEKLFTENEVAILRSSGMIMANALINNETFNQMMELQEKLKEENINTLEQFEMIWEKVESGIVIIDERSQVVLDANPAACRMYGGRENEIIGKTRYKIFGVQECTEVACDRTIDRKEREFIKADGTVIPILKSIAKVQYDGTPALLESFTDTSYLKAVDDHKRMQEVAEQTSNAKSIFLANMSHEMRTPLTTILGLAGLSLEYDGLAEETRSNLAKIYDAGATLLNTINDILDISKIEAKKLDLVETDYDVPSLINDTITQNVMRIGEKPIEFRLNINEDMYAQLYGDEHRVKQIMNNLLSNAIKYTDEGTVDLSVFCGREDDTIWLTIKVKDTGKGIRAEDKEKLFIEYYQADTKANRNIQGTGLGLPITKRLVEIMNGTITVESVYGKGSTFTVTIAQKFAGDTRIGPQIVENLKSFRYSDQKLNQTIRFKRIKLPYARVLVVDDNLTNLDVTKGLMKPYEMRIDCVNSGAKAIDIMQKRVFNGQPARYDAIFMDHMMPGMDGIEATQHIREIGTDYAKNIPIIALTANAVTGNEKKFLDSGFQAFLSKPIDLSRLDEVIRQWIRDKSKEQDTQDEYDSDDRKTSISNLLATRQIKGLDMARGLERYEEEDLYVEILRSYATNTIPLLDAITDVSEDNLTDYAITVHGIKGSSRGIFASLVEKSAGELELAAKAGDYNFVTRNNGSFVLATRSLIADIKDLLASLDSRNPKPKKDKPDRETLKHLSAACSLYDIDEVDKTMNEINSYQYESDDGLTVWLNENVRLTNFKEITERLSAAG